MSRLRPLRFAFARFAIAAAFCAAVAAGTAPDAAAQSAPPNPSKGRATAGEFDYYILALAWTPEECARVKGKNIPPYCADAARPGFVVRGLWPEFERGGRLENCTRNAPAVPEEMLEAIRPLMGADATIQQQWRRYGACTALSVDYYFADLRIAYERVKMPEIFKKPPAGFSLPAIEAVHRIADANPDLPPESIAGVCDKGRLVEVRVCVNKDLEARTCGSRVTANCGDRDSLTSP